MPGKEGFVNRRNRGLMLIALGLVLALGTGALVYYVLQLQSSTAAATARSQVMAEMAQTAPPMVKLPVARATLAQGHKITADDLEVKEFPENLVATGAVTQTELLVDRMLVRAVAQGETFQRNMLLGDASASLSQQIKPGQVAFAFPIVDLLNQSSLVNDGDHVDLLLTMQPVSEDGTPIGRKFTALTLQNIEVMKVIRPVDDNGKPGEPSALVCSVKPDEAVMLKHIKDSGGVIDFALRSPVDTEPFVAPAVDGAQLLARFVRGQ